MLLLLLLLLLLLFLYAENYFVSFRTSRGGFRTLFFSADRPNCAKFPSLKCTHISFWLNPTGHSKFHNTSNHPPPATDSGRTARTPLYPPGQAAPYSLPLFFFSPGQRNRRRLVPVPVTGVRYNSLQWSMMRSR